jgi:predicted amidohydrolase YtcJ
MRGRGDRLLIRQAFSRGRGTADIRVRGGRVGAVAPTLARRPGEEVLEAQGGEVVPGLHDHHVHLLAWAAAAGSVRLGPPEVRTPAQFDAVLAAANRRSPGGRWIRGIGYHESVAGELDSRRIDAVVANRPVRIQHRGGALWILNSPAVEALGPVGEIPPGMELDAGGAPTGRFWRLDSWLGTRVPRAEPDLAAVSNQAAARGVTGFTDASPHSDAATLALLAEAAAIGTIGQRLHLMTGPGVTAPRLEGASLGPVKILLDDVSLPSLEFLVNVAEDAHGKQRQAAFHCVTRAQAALACAAIREAGPAGDRIEHAAVMDLELAALVRQLGITVVTQPAFVRSRGDRYLEDVDEGDLPDLWRLRSLLAAGVAVAAGTDAPFGPSDPWVAVAAAADRTTEGGRRLGPSEAVDVKTASRLFAGKATNPGCPRTLDLGREADICILSGCLSAGAPLPPVLSTLVAGRVIYRTG